MIHKAFDYVNHKIFLAKLEFCSITGKFLNLIKSFLEDRSQKVSVSSNRVFPIQCYIVHFIQSINFVLFIYFTICEVYYLYC